MAFSLVGEALDAQSGAVLERRQARLLVYDKVSEGFALLAEAEGEVAVIAVLLPVEVLILHALSLRKSRKWNRSVFYSTPASSGTKAPGGG